MVRLGTKADFLKFRDTKKALDMPKWVASGANIYPLIFIILLHLRQNLFCLKRNIMHVAALHELLMEGEGVLEGHWGVTALGIG